MQLWILRKTKFLYDVEKIESKISFKSNQIFIISVLQNDIMGSILLLDITCQYINWMSSFSKCPNGTTPWRIYSINTLVLFINPNKKCMENKSSLIWVNSTKTLTEYYLNGNEVNDWTLNNNNKIIQTLYCWSQTRSNSVAMVVSNSKSS